LFLHLASEEWRAPFKVSEVDIFPAKVQHELLPHH
jgi:hypothetical protein